MALTRRDMARRLREADATLAASDAAAGVDAVVDCMRRALATGNKVMISGFGTFELRSRAARRGIDPSTGKPLVIAARRIVGFRASPALLAVLSAHE